MMGRCKKLLPKLFARRHRPFRRRRCRRRRCRRCQCRRRHALRQFIELGRNSAKNKTIGWVWRKKNVSWASLGLEFVLRDHLRFCFSPAARPRRTIFFFRSVFEVAPMFSRWVVGQREICQSSYNIWIWKDKPSRHCVEEWASLDCCANNWSRSTLARTQTLFRTVTRARQTGCSSQKNIFLQVLLGLKKTWSAKKTLNNF